ncbi:MAG: hypothetical protein PHP59_02640 [Methanofollis sp.]|uniref:hypothetical protein n=1 Tax=Methanofollis sp. TaxID=2052835 RepID=UPI00261D362E|nr:hypothetical protein [Methanofollis sp.]MDD4254255.1 hypothetical protein [Methanofollis sp.]
MTEKNAFENLKGSGVDEKFVSIGVSPGVQIDILELQRLSRRYGFRAVVYFEEEMAQAGDLAADEKEYADVPESDRPFVSVDDFLKFAREYDPYSFDIRLKELPIMIEVVSVGEIAGTPYVTGLMPFLDELDTFEEPEVMG